MGEGRGATGYWWGNLNDRDYLEDTGVDGRIILSGSSGNRLEGMD
jgi:hypothetical protein